MIRLDNQVALITGAGRGLGFEYARLFAERGAHVVMQDYGVDQDGTNHNSTVIDDAAAKIQSSKTGKIIPVSIDLANKDNCRELVDQLVDQFGHIDILVHNAGWVAYEEISELTPEFLQRALDVNILMPTWLLHYVLPVMKRRNYGRVVLTSSDRAIYGEYALAGLAPYAMGKMAQIGLMNALSVEVRDHNICVNTISPVSKTRMWGVMTEPNDLKPSQVSQGTLFLASALCEQSGYILRASNGQFTAVKWTEREGVDYPYNLNAFESSSAENIADNWKIISRNVSF